MTDTDLVVYEDETPTALMQWASAPTQAWGLADALLGMHPAAKEVGIEGLRTVAQLALLTGANPLPGTNGIHVWRDKEGRICHAFGMGFWRGEADRAGGLLWIIPPRLMTDEERKANGVAPGIPAAICSAALRADVFSLRAQARQFGDELTFDEAKREVARTGIGIGTANEYPKKGRPAGWTALMRAERDLLRQLVSIGTNGAPPPVRRDWSPRQLGDMTGHVPLVGAGGSAYTLADANRDLFGDDSPPFPRRVEEPEDGVIEDAAPEQQPPAGQAPTQTPPPAGDETPAAPTPDPLAAFLALAATHISVQMASFANGRLADWVRYVTDGQFDPARAEFLLQVLSRYCSAVVDGGGIHTAAAAVRAKADYEAGVAALAEQPDDAGTESGAQETQAGQDGLFGEGQGEEPPAKFQDPA